MSSDIDSDGVSSKGEVNLESINVKPLITVEKEETLKNEMLGHEEHRGQLEHPEPLIFGEFTNWKPAKMQRVSDFAFALHKKYHNFTGPSYEESEFHAILDEMNKINLEKPKEERMYFKRDLIHSVDDMTKSQAEFFERIKKQRHQ